MRRRGGMCVVIDVMKAEAGKKMKRDLKAAEEEDGTAGDKTEWMSMAQLWTRDSSQEDKESDVRFNASAALKLARPVDLWILGLKIIYF